MDAWEIIKNEVNDLCIDVNSYTFRKFQCNCSIDDDRGNYVIYIRDVKTNCEEKYYLSKIAVESLVDPKMYANLFCRKIKKDFGIIDA